MASISLLDAATYEWSAWTSSRGGGAPSRISLPKRWRVIPKSADAVRADIHFRRTFFLSRLVRLRAILGRRYNRESETDASLLALYLCCAWRHRPVGRRDAIVMAALGLLTRTFVNLAGATDVTRHSWHRNNQAVVPMVG